MDVDTRLMRNHLEKFHGQEREHTLTDLSSRIAARRAGMLLDVEGAAT